jgi:hypothetical protein
MKRAREATSTVGRVILLTSLLCLVLVLAFHIAGPVLVVAIFSAVILLAPVWYFPQAPLAVRVPARRRPFAPRAPPVF